MMLEESLAAFPDPVVRSSAQGGTTWKNAHFIESYAIIFLFSPVCLNTTAFILNCRRLQAAVCSSYLVGRTPLDHRDPTEPHY